MRRIAAWLPEPLERVWRRSSGALVRVVAGRYALMRCAGRGGMGEVWEARDQMIGRRVAVKLLPRDRRGAPGTAQSFGEARTAGALNHPGVVTVHDVGQDEASPGCWLWRVDHAVTRLAAGR